MKVDVAINVYKKPYHTIVAILSLLKHSGQHIDKIYFIQEKGTEFNFKKYLPNNVIYYIPEYYLAYSVDKDRLLEEDYRWSVRYQYAWEHTDKNFLFICHNDVLFTGDIIGGMLKEIGKNAAVGSVGQCWNCPAKTAGVCDSDKFEQYRPTYEEVINLIKSYPPVRMKIDMIDKDKPMPLPECRLNEFACLVNMKVKSELIPIGNTLPIGYMNKDSDTGREWFRDLYLKGYRFKNWSKYMKHGWTWTDGERGLGNLLDGRGYEKVYKVAENKAKNYLIKNYGFTTLLGTR